MLGRETIENIWHLCPVLSDSIAADQSDGGGGRHEGTSPGSTAAHFTQTPGAT
ncbi:hypothetical protein R75465_06546 [Paraburkholderia aspalathi]|nr:hypothetical protein R75465_06546 [Paraburkholderia aspalathi]